MSRVIRIQAHGGPEAMELVDLPVGEPGPGEIRIRHHACGVNFIDVYQRSGLYALPMPLTLGMEGAGVVEAVGPGVQESWLGLDVWVFEAAWRRRWGTTSEHTLVRETNLATLPVAGPDAPAYDLGAALGIPFITAHRCLTVSEAGPLRLGPGTLQGRTVLVSGGAGAVAGELLTLMAAHRVWDRFTPVSA